MKKKRKNSSGVQRAIAKRGRRWLGGFRSRIGNKSTLFLDHVGGKPFPDVHIPPFVPAPSGPGHAMETMGQRQRERRHDFKVLKQRGVHMATLRTENRARETAKRMMEETGV